MDLQGCEDVKAEKEHENIDLVLRDQNNKPIVAVEMKVHNHESCIAGKKPRTGRNYQTVEYPKRIEDAPPFLYITLGTGEFYRRKPYGEVQSVGLETFVKAAKKTADHDPAIEAWKNALSSELEFRTACKDGCTKDIEDEKKWNVYFLGFLRRELDNGNFSLGEADLTVYRHSQDTILHSGIEKPVGNRRAYCYMEINSNSKLNLKANLEQLHSQGEKQRYVSRAEDHYSSLVKKAFHKEKGRHSAVLKKTKIVMSFDVGLRKQGKCFVLDRGMNETCEK